MLETWPSLERIAYSCNLETDFKSSFSNRYPPPHIFVFIARNFCKLNSHYQHAKYHQIVLFVFYDHFSSFYIVCWSSSFRSWSFHIFEYSRTIWSLLFKIDSKHPHKIDTEHPQLKGTRTFSSQFQDKIYNI